MALPKQMPSGRRTVLSAGRVSHVIKAQASVAAAPPATGVIADKKAELAINGGWDNWEFYSSTTMHGFAARR